MKRKLHLFFIVLTVLFGSSVNAQYTYWTEYFDDGATAITGTTANAATTPTPATIKTGSWTTYYSFRAGAGCAAYNDPAQTSPKYIRILGTAASTPPGLSSNANGPYAYLITPSLTHGVNQVTWRNNSTSTSGSISIYYSTNDGASWTLAQAVSTVATGCDNLYSVTINNAAVNKIKFQNETTANQEIDNVTITSVNPLPVTFAGSKAYAKEKGIQVEWSTATESNIHYYSVERSVNGKDFSSVGTVESKGNSSSLSTYSFYDAMPVAGTNYYRIKALDKDGSVKYTGIMQVNISRGKAEVVIAPNPVRNNEVNIRLSDFTKGNYTVRVLNNVGQVVFTAQVSTEGSSLTKSFRLPSTVRAGVYTLQVAGNDISLNKKIVIE